MESTTAHAEHHDSGKKLIYKVTIILTILTLIELAFGFWMISIHNQLARHFIKGIIVILMIAKAYYIVAFFMHLKHEFNNFVWTILVPLTLFIWFIISFLADGDSVKNLRNKYDRYFESQSHIKIEKNEGKPNDTAPKH
ncbi:MAG: cytochrome C oxidase subunit IV family protein [Alphaproteobacteria bacterium]|nr:cytochrome C oxidase subunit IV family protein [Alphaproteobacteria bacterium]